MCMDVYMCVECVSMYACVRGYVHMCEVCGMYVYVCECMHVICVCVYMYMCVCVCTDISVKGFLEALIC